MTEPCGQLVLSQKTQFDSDKPSSFCVPQSLAAKATQLPPLVFRLSEVLSEGGKESMCACGVECFCVYVERERKKERKRERKKEHACVHQCV